MCTLYYKLAVPASIPSVGFVVFLSNAVEKA
jgi:hypothetical protein